MNNVVSVRDAVESMNNGQPPYVEKATEGELWDLIESIKSLVSASVRYRSGGWDAEIFFKNSTGSSIFARSVGSDRRSALDAALLEAIRLW